MKKTIFLVIIAITYLSCGKLIKSITEKDRIAPNQTSTEIKTTKQFVDEAIDHDYKVEAMDSGIYLIDYPLSYDDGDRFQGVYIRDWYDETGKKQTYFINSYICDFTPDINLKDILIEADFGRMSMICIKNIPDGNGGMKEALYTQSAVPVNYINGDFDEFMAIVYEVAANADYIEKKFKLGEDLN